MQTHLFSRRPIVLSMQDIDSLTKDSPIALLNALYQCQDFVFVDSKNNPSLSDSNITQTFGYKSAFYLSFIANKDSLSNEYLQARKALYKTYQLIKQEQAEDLQKQQQELEQ
ncbi:MAG: lipase, partial [Helicobacter trogontum]|nr:lipase [Helicobacter trogontum]